MSITNFSFEESDINGVFLITPFFSIDSRGYFVKNFEKDIYIATGENIIIQEQFETMSLYNVIRGLHFQTNNPQIKIVRAISGKIFDVVVDLRKNSKTFGQWRHFILSDENKQSLFIPKGCAHGFLVLSDIAHISYMCTEKFSSESDTGIVWNDKTLNISWPYDSQIDIIISNKDSHLQTFKNFLEINGGFN